MKSVFLLEIAALVENKTSFIRLFALSLHFKCGDRLRSLEMK